MTYHQDDAVAAVAGRGDDVLLVRNGDFHGGFTLLAKASEDELRRHERAYAEQEPGPVLRPPPGASCLIVPESEWHTLKESITKRAHDTSDGAVLVSLVFCTPDSIVFRDLTRQFAYLNLRSGQVWDLYFAGYTCPVPGRVLPPSPRGIPLWQFRPAKFHDLWKHIRFEHTRSFGENPYYCGRPWRYSGRPELVSFMAYRDFSDYFGPTVRIDWPSLRAVPLADANGDYLDHSLSEIVETMSDWRDTDNAAIRRFAPGERPAVESALSLGSALRVVGSAMAGGIAGNAAYDLLKQIIGQ